MASPPDSSKQEEETCASSREDARYYAFDTDKLEALKEQSPWKDDPRYFNRVALSPAAIMKMMMHCHSGVEQGVKKGGNPVEKMGLLLGRPDTDAMRSLVVTDVFPLPIEGFETRVIADDIDVINHMITLTESIERTRKEIIMGWYHSHPFDVGSHSHCYLSQTDISTQLQWQRTEDTHGNPWLAIVVDPLRSLVKNVPVIKAFRAYPPEYKSPVRNECPDGEVLNEEQARLEKWGSCWSRYYELDVDYFMSSSARKLMGILTQNFSWMRTLGSTPMLEADSQKRFPERVSAVAEKIKTMDISGSVAGGGPSGGMISSGQNMGQSRYGMAGLSGDASLKDDGEMSKACQGVVDLATEKLHGNIVQVVKGQLFS